MPIKLFVLSFFLKSCLLWNAPCISQCLLKLSLARTDRQSLGIQLVLSSWSFIHILADQFICHATYEMRTSYRRWDVNIKQLILFIFNSAPDPFVGDQLGDWAALHFISWHWLAFRVSIMPTSHIMLQPSRAGHRSSRDFFLIRTFWNSGYLSNRMSESNNSKRYTKPLNQS